MSSKRPFKQVLATADAADTNPVSNQATGQCLAVPGGSKDNGTQVIQWSCNSAADQKWSFK
ncbi:RICIN domain-containing protein [Streptomyces sp. NPDC088124]|uniref:RICIN domain-containing protein n=1 Tax=Streptomyces sp. NPDC088124 TaxID=3154654 RepID=UPI00343F9482